MAFAITGQTSVNLGGGLIITTGQWTGAVGDAAGTLSVRGGAVMLKNFYLNDASGYADPVPVVDVTGALAGTRDLTIYNNVTCTAGTFVILSRVG